MVPEADLAQYNQAYLNEGYIDGKLYILPVAKSTELLLMNQTRLDEFLGGQSPVPGGEHGVVGRPGTDG